jgi:hypothetical protein
VALIHQPNEEVAERANQERVPLLHGATKRGLYLGDGHNKNGLGLSPEWAGPGRIDEIHHQRGLVSLRDEPVAIPFQDGVEARPEPGEPVFLTADKRKLHTHFLPDPRLSQAHEKENRLSATTGTTASEGSPEGVTDSLLRTNRPRCQRARSQRKGSEPFFSLTLEVAES